MLNEYLLIGTIMWPLWKYKKIKCPDGSHYVIKNIDDAFPLSAKNIKANFDGALKAFQNLEGRLSADFKSEIVGLFAIIDQANRSLQFQFRGLYVSYMENPCSNGEFLREGTQKIIEREDKLRKLQIMLKTLGNNEQSNGRLKDYVYNDIIGKKPHTNDKNKFKEALDNTSEWVKGIDNES